MKSGLLVGHALSASDREEKARRLFEAYRTGQREAFTSLYSLYEASLLNYGCSMIADRQRVDDCVHDVFLQLLTRDIRRPVLRVGDYLFTALRNRIVDSLRHDAHTADSPADALLAGRGGESVETAYIRMEHEQRVHKRARKLIGELTPRQRQAFRLYFLEERKYGEICTILNMDYAGVRNLVHRGMVKIRSSEAYQHMKVAADW